MYLVRKIRRTGKVQVYDLDPCEPSDTKPGKLRKRAPHAWVFNKGFAAIDDTVAHALIRLDKLESDHASLVS